MRFPNPLLPFASRLRAALWTLRAARRLRRGDAAGAARACAEALRRRPGRFPLLMRAAEANLRARDLPAARRYLALARESDPRRYDLRAAGMLARCGFDLEAVCRPTRVARPQPVTQPVGLPRRLVTSANLPYGDCRDVDEYARFRAMPPITAGEIAALDWDNVLGDLLD
jgi:hypothetical protein